VFLDAVDYGGAPGSAVLLGAAEIAQRFPQVSTHRISLGTLARVIESRGRTKVWLLGVQPESLRPGTTLTRTVQRTREMLVALCQPTPSEVAR
jgi:hydrogenase maturation protease